MRIAVAGLHFGAEFVPIYQHHPDVERVAVCDPDEQQLHRVAEQFGIQDRFTASTMCLPASNTTPCIW